jgi:hypothetical protein
MRFHHKVAMIVTLCFGTFVQTTANAQSGFFITYSVLGIASCSATSLQGTVTATYNLPAASNNLYSSVSINGETPVIAFFSINPPATTSSLPFSFPIVATPQPYTIQAIVYPAQNGAPVGSGARATYTCNVDGTVSAVFAPIANGTINVPTLSQWVLAALAVLLALASWVQLRRKR